MIKKLKVKDAIHEGVCVKIVDDNGNEIDNPIIPQDIEALRAVTIGTLSWLIGDAVRRATGDAMKLNAANSKAITLLAKLIAPTADTTSLTANEKAALDKLTALADNGYADSALLNASLDAVIDNIATYSTLIEQAVVAKTRDELIGMLEGVK